MITILFAFIDIPALYIVVYIGVHPTRKKVGICGKEDGGEVIGQKRKRSMFNRVHRCKSSVRTLPSFFPMFINPRGEWRHDSDVTELCVSVSESICLCKFDTTAIYKRSLCLKIMLVPNQVVSRRVRRLPGACN